MPKATFISPGGEVARVDVDVGTSLMQAAVDHAITSIHGECGGAMTCATCHVFVEPEFLALLDEPSETETAMLDYTNTPRQPNSRLSCQLIMTDAMNGMVVRVAEQ